MADVTPIYGLPYLELGDPPNLAAGTKNLADAVEDELGRIDAAVAGLTRLQYAHTTADIATPLSAAWGNVTGFSFAAAAGKAYAIDCVLFLENPSTSGADWRAGWTWTGAGAMTMGQDGLDVNVVAPAYNGNSTAHAILNDTASPLQESTGLGTPAAIPVVARVFATYICTTSGTVQMQHAQAVADASFATRVKHGSRMRVERMN
jgi:hypothetical protein